MSEERNLEGIWKEYTEARDSGNYRRAYDIILRNEDIFAEWIIKEAGDNFYATCINTNPYLAFTVAKTCGLSEEKYKERVGG